MAVRDSHRAAVVGLLGVAGIAVAAAALDATPVYGDGGSRADTGGAGGGSAAPPPAGPADAIPYLPEIVVGVLVLGVLLALFYAARHWRTVLLIGFAVVAFLGLTVLLHAVFGTSETAVLPPLFEPVEPPASDPDGGAPGPSRPPGLGAVLGVLGLLVALGLIALNRRRGAGSAPGSAATTADRETADAVGRAAGRAADRMEDEDSDNEIYRAWREMTGLLDVADPAKATPGEFAEAAVAAGLGREDVRALTRLFEDVRYGDATPTAGDEARAVAVLRRIEARYAGADA